MESMSTITRIATLSTFNRYKPVLQKLISKYLKKSWCDDTEEEILKDIELNCHNPYSLTCMIDDSGFAVVLVQPTLKGKKAIIEHFYCPNSVAIPVYRTIMQKIKSQFEIIETIFITYRNPEAWLRFTERHGLKLNVKSYLLFEES